MVTCTRLCSGEVYIGTRLGYKPKTKPIGAYTHTHNTHTHTTHTHTKVLIISLRAVYQFTSKLVGSNSVLSLPKIIGTAMPYTRV